PRDTLSFTQGLELYNGILYESGGLYGESLLRTVNPNTAEVIQTIPLEATYFAEGLTILDGRLFQLTWKEETAFVYDAATLAFQEEFPYEGEGWGLTNDGKALIMSNGSAELTFRNPETFQAFRTVTVTYNGKPVLGLNELEYARDHVYANVLGEDAILKIAPGSGRVVQVIEATALRPKSQRTPLQVLNGIAYDSATDRFLLTGKQWPALFEVEMP
ncbi:MAG: glutaminyl-peptide cyclotransferase, partial [Candidatus Sumerlaeia bacterium]|nr:glutaminyl-peptide cyclotransferase [Candidatus Sumerlaeia bacterium]